MNPENATLTASQRYRAKRRAAGLCQHCDQPSRPKRLDCASCAAKAITETRARYAKLRAAGICTSCGTVPVQGGASQTPSCAACRERQKKVSLAFQKRRRAKVLREGLCTSCGKPGRRANYLYCDECATKGKLKRYRKYGLTPESLVALGDACHICGSTKDLAIDHDHNLGVIRGLLCRLCNNGIGMFRDSPKLLSKAGRYLRKARKPAKVVKPAPLTLVFG